MKTHILVPALCVLLLPSAAFAGDYERKNYLESYERNYERHGEVPSATRVKNFDTPAKEQPTSSSSFDEYSLYEWTESRSSEASVTPPSRGFAGYLEKMAKEAEDEQKIRSALNLDAYDEMIDKQARRIDELEREQENKRIFGDSYVPR